MTEFGGFNWTEFDKEELNRLSSGEDGTYRPVYKSTEEKEFFQKLEAVGGFAKNPSIVENDQSYGQFTLVYYELNHAILSNLIRSFDGANEKVTERVVILIHGIRTFANWQPMVTRVLEEIPGTRVVALQYGYFDAFRFWCPFFTRQFPIGDVRREIQNVKNSNPDAKYSVIAHSFGTYIISKILLADPDLSLNHLVLSGCIVSRRYRWDYVKSRIATPIVNDYGTKDIWPVMAKCLSWGYGDTGRHGFGRTHVMDRGHDYEHSQFFNEEFVRTYWKPWIEKQSFVQSIWGEKTPPASWWLSMLSVVPFQWIVLVATLFLVAWLNWPKPNSADNSPTCLLYTSPSPRDATLSRMPSSA